MRRLLLSLALILGPAASAQLPGPGLCSPGLCARGVDQWGNAQGCFSPGSASGAGGSVQISTGGALGSTPNLVYNWTTGLFTVGAGITVSFPGYGFNGLAGSVLGLTNSGDNIDLNTTDGRVQVQNSSNGSIPFVVNVAATGSQAAVVIGVAPAVSTFTAAGAFSAPSVSVASAAHALDDCTGGTLDGAIVRAGSTQATACTSGGGTLTATGINAP